MKTNNIAEMRRQDVIDALRPHVPAKRFEKILYYSTEQLKAILFYFEIGGGAEELSIRKQFDPSFSLILTMIKKVRGSKPVRKLQVKSVTEFSHG